MPFSIKFMWFLKAFPVRFQPFSKTRSGAQHFPPSTAFHRRAPRSTEFSLHIWLFHIFTSTCSACWAQCWSNHFQGGHTIPYCAQRCIQYRSSVSSVLSSMLVQLYFQRGHTVQYCAQRCVQYCSSVSKISRADTWYSIGLSILYQSLPQSTVPFHFGIAGNSVAHKSFRTGENWAQHFAQFFTCMYYSRRGTVRNCWAQCWIARNNSMLKHTFSGTLRLIFRQYCTIAWRPWIHEMVYATAHTMASHWCHFVIPGPLRN